MEEKNNNNYYKPLEDFIKMGKDFDSKCSVFGIEDEEKYKEFKMFSLTYRLDAVKAIIQTFGDISAKKIAEAILLVV